MNFFKKILIPSRAKQELTAYESWVVRWTSRTGPFSGDGRPEAEVFTTEEDANIFAKQLKEAFRLIRYDKLDNVKVEKNK